MDNIVPDRHYRERTHPSYILPKDLRDMIKEIANRFSVDIANLVVLAYQEWGAQRAREFANKILTFSGFEELMSFLRRRATRFGRGREYINAILYNYHYTTLLERLAMREYRCPSPEERLEAKQKARDILVRLAKYGLFFTEECIAQLAEYLTGCRDKLTKSCQKIYDTFVKIGEHREPKP